MPCLVHHQNQSTFTGQPFVANVSYPDGVTATSFGIVFYDNSQDVDFCAYLYRYPFFEEYPVKMAEVCSFGAAAGNRGTGNSITTDPVIDMEGSYYEIVVDLPGGVSNPIGLKGFQLGYHYPDQVYLPTVTR